MDGSFNWGGSFSTNNSVAQITLPAAPASAYRDDLVFLEVWKTELHSNSTNGKPSATTIYTYGNTQYGGTNPPDQIINPTVGFETSSRIQLQYRIRVVAGANFAHPEGVDDFTSVFAQGNTPTPNNSYSFTNVGSTWNDYGLYVSGTGSSTDASTLGTVDGYVYAVPMFRVRRRNTSAYSFSNINGSSVSVLANTLSDRPDGLFYDEINLQDIEDLRHKVTFGVFNHPDLLQKNYSNILSGQANTFLSIQNVLGRTSQGFQIDAIANSAPLGTALICQPSGLNGQERYFSDVPSLMPAVNKITAPGGGWLSSSLINLFAPTTPPLTTIISSSPPVVMFAQSNSGPIVTLPNAFWSSTYPSSPVITLGLLNGVASGLTTQDLYVMYEIDYPQIGNKLTEPLTEMLLVQNTATSQKWGDVSVNDYDSSLLAPTPYRRPEIIPSRITNGFTDYAYTYRVSNYSVGSPYQGVGTLYSYYLNGTGGLSYVVPGSLINALDAGYVLGAYFMTAPTTPLNISCTRDPITSNITVNLPTTLANGQTVRFDVALLGGVLEFDERTQSITDMGQVSFYSIMGNNTNTIILDKSSLNVPVEIFIGGQTQINSSSTYVSTCYVNNTTMALSSMINVSGTPLVQMTFSGSVLSSSTITIALYTKKTLTSSDSLCISYNYKAYKGISQKLGSSDSINSKIIYFKDLLQIMSNGTGAVNTALTLPKSYENLIDVLPHPNGLGFNTGYFTGTAHTAQDIIGGLYASTLYNTPYTAGEANFMTMVGNTNSTVNFTHGTSQGGYFATTARASDGTINKLVVAALLEMITSDTSGNFLPGELGMKVETNYIQSNILNQITNSSYGATNTYDMFKLEGRPLYKMKNKES